MRAADNRHDHGFTLLEMLVALTILVTAMAVVWTIFSTTLIAWKKGQKLMSELHHGDFVMEQLVAAMRSAAFFDTAPDKFGFWLDDSEGEYPEDTISWVKSGTAFMPVESPLLRGLHRIELSIQEKEDGDSAVAVRAWPHLAEKDDIEDVQYWFVSSMIKGIDCRVYNFEDEDWDEDWENTNAIPAFLEITLYMDPLNEYEDPVTIKRAIQIPVGHVITNAIQFGGSSDDQESDDVVDTGGSSSPAAQLKEKR